uniref:Uncharacterized protein n=1 Tax=Panagrolaimus sp. ES5 TaxID=591445 RepID=A0AC34GDC9_9BILA
MEFQKLKTNVSVLNCFKGFPLTYTAEIIPRLYRCEAKHIELNKQNLNFQELKFFIEHGGVVSLDIHGWNNAGKTYEIKDENDETVDLERVTQYLPNIESFKIAGVKCNKNTAHALARQKFNSKIFEFYVDYFYAGAPFDCEEFLSFCAANRSERFALQLTFQIKFDRNFIKELQKTIYGYKNSTKKTFVNVNFNLFEL